MTTGNELYRRLYEFVIDPETVDIIKRAMTHKVVLDTWMHGEFEELIEEDAQELLRDYVEKLTRQAIEQQAIFPLYSMSFEYIESLLTTTLTSMALFIAHTQQNVRIVTVSEIHQAFSSLQQFVDGESSGLRAVAVVFNAIWSYEDLNAILYYRRMPRQNFLSGAVHRPGPSTMLTFQLTLYKVAGIVQEVFAGDGDMLELTERGVDIFEHLARILNDSGELAWRANQQRWVIFHEMDYDEVFSRLSPDHKRNTKMYLDSLNIKPGFHVLEIGAGTGRITIDSGLCQRVRPGGTIVAVDQSQVLLEQLHRKIERNGIDNVEAVLGRAEQLPLADNTVDATLAVYMLHFTEAEQAIQEMVRVTKPGGLVTAISAAPEADVRAFPMGALWFRPLADLAERFGLPFGERNGFVPGKLQDLFREAGLVHITMTPYSVEESLEDHRNVFTFAVKGAAFFQNILSRLPYTERQHFIRRLEERGDEIAQAISPEEKKHTFLYEAVVGYVPLTKLSIPDR